MNVINKIIDCFENVAMIVLMIIATVVAIIQVIARYVFSHSLYWSEEVILYSLICMSFIAASMGVRYGAHISVELVNIIPSKRLKDFLGFITVLLGVLFAISIFYYGFLLFQRTFDMNQLSPAMQIPVAYVYLVIPISGFLMLFRYINILVNLFKNQPQIPDTETPLSI